MAAALKKTDDKNSAVAEQVEPTTILIDAVDDVRPTPSPAREMQAALARQLEQTQPSNSEVLIGLIVGVCGASWVTGILIYATL